MNTIIFEYDYAESGFCRVHYKININKNSYHYCIMDDGYDNNMLTDLYRCSKDGEPDCKVSFPNSTLYFEEPEDAYSKSLLINWLSDCVKRKKCKDYEIIPTGSYAAFKNILTDEKKSLQMI